MTKSIKFFLPIDINTNSASYQIPTIENAKDAFTTVVNNAPPEEENNNGPARYGRGQRTSQFEKVLSEFHNGWIDVMSFSHNVANGSGVSRKKRWDNFDEESEEGNSIKETPIVADFTMTKFVDLHTPALNYICLRTEVLPHGVLRVIGDPQTEDGKHTILIIEYEFQNISISNVSVSGGAGGKPVETMSVSPRKLFKIKYIELDLINNEFSTYQVVDWDIKKESGTRTPISKFGSSSKSLLEYAKKHLMIDLDSHDPSMVALIKELGLISEQDLELNAKKETAIRVLTNNEPNVFKSLTVQGALSRQSIVKAISDKFNTKVEGVYYYPEGVEIEESDKISQKTYFFKTSEGFYGFKK